MNEKLSVLVGQRIRYYRKLRRYTQEQLGKLISCSKSTIAKYETGAIILDIDTCNLIAETLQISLQQLLDCPVAEKRIYDPQTMSQRNGLFRDTHIFLFNLTAENTIKKSLMILDPASDAASCYFDIACMDPLCSLFYYRGKSEFYHSLARFTFADQTAPFDQTIFTFPNMTSMQRYYVGYADTVIQPSYTPAIVKMIATTQPEPPESIWQECKPTKEELAFFKKRNYFVPNIKWWY